MGKKSKKRVSNGGTMSEKQKDRAAREAKAHVETEEGKSILEQIVKSQKAQRKENKKKGKKTRMMQGAGSDSDDMETGGADEDAYDSEREALMRIKASQKPKGKQSKPEQDSEESGSEDDKWSFEDEDEPVHRFQVKEADQASESSAEEDDFDVERTNALLLEKLDDIKVNLPFRETLQIVSTKPMEFANVNDDLQREVEFYKQAIDAVKAGRQQLDQLGVPHMRPTDYFADMVKSDEHMARIKQNLLFERKKMEAFELRKKQQEYKKFAKKVQAEKQKEKAAKKKQVKEVAQEFKEKSKDKLVTSRKRSREEPNAKRMAKNKKYGFGEKKSRKNDSESVGSMFAREGGNNKRGQKGQRGRGNFKRRR